MASSGFAKPERFLTLRAAKAKALPMSDQPDAITALERTLRLQPDHAPAQALLRKARARSAAGPPPGS